MYRGNKYNNYSYEKRMNLSLIIGIIILAVALGYFFAKLVIYPVLTNENVKNDQDIKNLIDKFFKIEDEIESEDIKENVPEESEGVYIQFGCFSTSNRATEFQNELKLNGIDSDIVERDGKFKVISKLFESKENASYKLQELQETRYTDAFITHISTE